MTPDYRAWLEEMFSPLGRVSIRPFFGLDGIWLSDAMVGLVWNERVHFKTDEAGRKLFEREGATAFSYRTGSGETIVTSYLAVPERLYDEPQEFIEWARRAHEVALVSPAAKRRQKRNGRSMRPAAKGPARKRDGDRRE